MATIDNPCQLLPAICLACSVVTAAAAATGGQGPQSPPPAVTVAAVRDRPAGISARFVGRIQAIPSVDIRARVTGFLERVAFDEGADVAKDQLLYVIEQPPYEADLASAKGQLAAAEADQAAAEAQLTDAQAEFDRYQKLLEKGDTTPNQVDEKRAARDQAKASVEKAKAEEQQARASIQTARINLSYTTVESPIAGRIGATTYTEGNLVGPASQALATVVQLDPIRAVFSVPSKDWVEVIEARAKDSSTRPSGQFFVPELLLPTGEKYEHPGKIAFASNQINPGTGTIAVYADFPNPAAILLPGQFITVSVHQRKEKSMPVVPIQAVQETKDGKQVYVLGAGNRIELRRIETSEQIGDGYAVTEGLDEGELVVISGIQKVAPGMVVSPTRADQRTEGARSAAKGGQAEGKPAADSGG